MAGAYEQAFQKWLKGKQSKNDDDDDSSESGSSEENHLRNDGVKAYDFQGLSDTTDSGDSNGEGNDNDDVEGDPLGPPKLHPVHHLDEAGMDNDKVMEYSNNTSFYRMIEKRLQKNEICGVNGKRRKQSKTWKNKSPKHSANIFDTFDRESNQNDDDSPPPLIPSLELMVSEPALEFGQGEATKPVINSPNFCAMEADSTSEIQDPKAKLEHSGKGDRVDEMSVECDSTCMIGNSVTSPNSTDAEDCKQLCHKRYKSVEIQCNAECLDGKVGNIKNVASELANESLNNIHSELKGAGKAVEENNNQASTDGKGTRGRDDRSFDKGVEVDFQVDVRQSERNCIPIDVKDQNVISHPPKDQMKRKHYLPMKDAVIGPSKVKKRTQSCPVPPTSISKPSKSRAEADDRVNLPICSKSHSSFRSSELINRSLSLNDKASIFVQASQQLSNLQTQMHTLLSKMWPSLHLHSMTPESHQFNCVLNDLVMLLESPYKNSKAAAHPVGSNSLGSAAGDEQIAKLSSMSFNSSPTISITYKNEKKIDEEGHPFEIETNVPPKSEASKDMSIHPKPQIKSLMSASTDSHSSDCVSVLEESQSCNEINLEKKVHPEDVKNNSLVRNLTEPVNQSLHGHNQSSVTSNQDKELPHLDLSCLTISDPSRSQMCLMSACVVLPRDADDNLARFSELTCRALQLLLPDISVSFDNELCSSPLALSAMLDNILKVNEKKQKKKKF